MAGGRRARLLCRQAVNTIIGLGRLRAFRAHMQGVGRLSLFGCGRPDPDIVFRGDLGVYVVRKKEDRRRGASSAPSYRNRISRHSSGRNETGCGVTGQAPRQPGGQHDRGETLGRSPAAKGVTAVTGAPRRPAESLTAHAITARIPVLGRDGAPLMPAHPARVRKLLRSGRAVVVSRIPFVIRLKDKTTTDGTALVQEMGLGIDPGSKRTGLAVFNITGTTNIRHGVFAAEVVHRSGVITRSLLARSRHRHSRRRKVRYRQPRHKHRAKHQGWLAPSLQHRVEGAMSMVNKMRSCFPITSIVLELARFDMQKLEDAEIKGVEYQQGSLWGLELREYLLTKFQHRCVYCDAKNVPLNLDHLEAKSRGGSDRLSNRVLACVKCNDAKGARPVEDFVTDPVRLARILAWSRQPLRDAAAVNSTRLALCHELARTGLALSTGSGGQTKFNRVRNGLEKTHCTDALAVGEVDRIVSYPASVLFARQTGRGSYARTRSNRIGFPRLIFPRCKSVYGYFTGDTVRAVVPAGKYTGSYVGRVSVRNSGRFAVRSATSVAPSVKHEWCTLLQRGAGWYFEIS